MKKIMRKLAVLAGAVAVSVGLMGATAVPAHADDNVVSRIAAKDTQW